MLAHEPLKRLTAELKIDQERVAREFYEILILHEMAQEKWGRQLIFKGGTALRLAYKSPRFSDDLDFSLITTVEPRWIFEFADTIAQKYAMSIRDQYEKRETILVEFAIVEAVLPQPFGIKIEISKRSAASMTHELKLLRTPVSPLEVLTNVQTLASILVDKKALIEIRDEPRDMFDFWFICQKLEIPFKAKSRMEKKIAKQILHKYLPINWHRVIDEIY